MGNDNPHNDEPNNELESQTHLSAAPDTDKVRKYAQYTELDDEQVNDYLELGIEESVSADLEEPRTYELPADTQERLDKGIIDRQPVIGEYIPDTPKEMPIRSNEPQVADTQRIVDNPPVTNPYGIETAPGVSYFAPTAKPWEMLPGETKRAFDAWQLFIKVKEESGGSANTVAKKLGVHHNVVLQWASKFNWNERYRAYENHQLLILEHERRLALRKEADKWAKRRSQTRELGYELGMMLADRAKRLLALPLAKQTIKRTTTTASGETVPTEITLEFQSHPRDARLFIDSGLKAMRLAADMSTENIASIPENLDLENMSVEELDAYADKLLQMRNVTPNEE